MKKLILLLTLTFCMFYGKSQDIPLAMRMNLTTHVVYQEDTLMGDGVVGILYIWVEPIPVYIVESSKQLYINYFDARLKEHRRYLGYAFPELNWEYENNTLFFNKDRTKTWIWSLDRYGIPMKMEMPDWYMDEFTK